MSEKFHLENMNLYYVIKKDLPLEKMVEALRQWQGPMDPSTVAELTEYLDPDRVRQCGRPPTSESAKDSHARHVMWTYFFLCAEGEGNPDDEILQWYGISKSAFKLHRARYNKLVAKEFYWYLQNTKAGHDEIIKYQKSFGMPEGYWEKFIQKEL